MAMRLYTPKEFREALADLGFKPTGRKTDTQELWVSEKDNKEPILVPITDQMIPDYVLDSLFANYDSLYSDNPSSIKKKFSLTENNCEVLSFQQKLSEQK